MNLRTPSSRIRQDLQAPVPAWQIIAASLAGFVLVVLLLAVAVFKDDIPGPNFKIIWAIVAISCAAFAAIVPGFLEVRYKRWLQASGAIAVFALIYFNQPVVTSDESGPGPIPSASPTEKALSWLKMMDEEKYSDAWDALSRASQQKYPKPSFLEMSSQLRKPLGASQSRILTHMAGATQLPTGERGHFSGVIYRTKLASGKEIFESVVMQGVGDKWQPYNYTLAPVSAPPMQPIQ
jgi:uncharacterized protein DUF4019